MYYKNISLHLAYLQTNEKKIIFVKKKFAELLFFLVRPLSHPFDSEIQSVLNFLKICFILYSSSRCNAEKIIYNL